MMKKNDHWLVKKTTIRKLWLIFFIILSIAILSNFFVIQYNNFGIDSTFGFYSWYGFFACVILVLVAKILGYLIKRPDNFYKKKEENEE
tara:strand:- start:69742 stop:70008 length:267 start_codon:yes stop_codon:yes gene_type:complete